MSPDVHQFKFGLIGHHILVPLGFKDQIYSGRFDTFQTLYPKTDILDYEIRQRAAGRCQRHINADIGVIIDIDLVDKPKIVYVNGYLRIINGLEYLYDFLLYIKLLTHL